MGVKVKGAVRMGGKGLGGSGVCSQARGREHVSVLSTWSRDGAHTWGPTGRRDGDVLNSFGSGCNVPVKKAQKTEWSILTCRRTYVVSSFLHFVNTKSVLNVTRAIVSRSPLLWGSTRPRRRCGQLDAASRGDRDRLQSVPLPSSEHG